MAIALVSILGTSAMADTQTDTQIDTCSAFVAYGQTAYNASLNYLRNKTTANANTFKIWIAKFYKVYKAKPCKDTLILRSGRSEGSAGNNLAAALALAGTAIFDHEQGRLYYENLHHAERLFSQCFMDFSNEEIGHSCLKMRGQMQKVGYEWDYK